MNTRIYLTLLVFIIGNLTCQWQSRLNPDFWVFGATIGLALWLLRIRTLACFFLGFCWSFTLSHIQLSQQLPAKLEGKDLVVQGTVSGLPQYFGNSTRFNFKPDSGTAADQHSLPRLLRLSWYFPDHKIESGQEWRLTIRLKRPNGTLNPGGFDYERWLFWNGIGATGYVRDVKSAKLLSGNDPGVSIENARQLLNTQLSAALNNSEITGLVKALTIGSRSEITPSQWQVLRATGTAHLIAISGLHIGLVATLSFLFSRHLWCYFGNRWYSPNQLAALTAILTALAYAALAGFSVPTQRAIVMVMVTMIALISQRYVKPTRILIIALFVVTTLDPFAALSPGFWLSFSAVALIIFFFAGNQQNVSYWIVAAKVQWVAAIGLTPLLLFFFHKASLIAPIANLIAVPFVSLIIVPLLLIGILLLALVPGIGLFVLSIAAYLIEILWLILESASTLSISEWSTTPPSIFALIMAILAVLLTLSPKGIPSRWLAAVLILPLLFNDKPRPDANNVWIDLLDVGQGLSVVARTAEKTLVYDTGARYSDRFDMGRSVVAPFLRMKGIGKIDILVISHHDIDHVGGAQSLATEFPIEKIYVSDPKRMDWTDTIPCLSGQSWAWNGVTFRFLSPFNNQALTDNNDSCVLQLSSIGGTTLLPGDIESLTERSLVKKYGDELKSDILIVPHHGSNTSSSKSFIEAVSPKYALISAGYRNRFGFPKPDVVERLKAIDSQILTTSQNGSINIKIDQYHGVETPQSYRLIHGHYWNRR